MKSQLISFLPKLTRVRIHKIHICTQAHIHICFKGKTGFFFNTKNTLLFLIALCQSLWHSSTETILSRYLSFKQNVGLSWVMPFSRVLEFIGNERSRSQNRNFVISFTHTTVTFSDISSHIVFFVGSKSVSVHLVLSRRMF